MKIKRYRIVPDGTLGQVRTIDILKDEYVCIPLVCDSEEDMRELMGKDMDKFVDDYLVHPNYLIDA